MNALSGIGPADAVLGLLIGASTVSGLFRGLFREVFSLVVWVAALVIAYLFSPALEPVIVGAVDNQALAAPAAFVILFVLMLIVGGLLVRLGVSIIGSAGLSAMDRVAGMVFGALRGGVIGIVILVALKPYASAAAWWNASALIGFLLGFEREVVEGIAYVSEALSAIWARLGNGTA